MKLRKGFIMLLAAFCALALCACMDDLAEDYQGRRQALMANASDYVTKWLAENEPDAVAQRPFKFLAMPEALVIKGPEATSRAGYYTFAHAICGSYLLGDEEVKFVYVEEDMSEETGVPGKKELYVSKLPAKQEQELLQEICKDLPVSYQTLRLSVGDTVNLPVWGLYMESGFSFYFRIPVGTTKENPYGVKMVPADLTAERLGEKVQSVPVSDAPMEIKNGSAVLDYSTTDDSAETKLKVKEYERFNSSTWCNHLKVEIQLEDANFPEHEKELLTWVRDAGIAEAVFLPADGGNCWTITRSCIMTADPDMEYAKVYCDHFTVKHNDNELYYDELTLSRIEAYIDPFGECMVREVAVN